MITISMVRKRPAGVAIDEDQAQVKIGVQARATIDKAATTKELSEQAQDNAATTNEQSTQAKVKIDELLSANAQPEQARASIDKAATTTELSEQLSELASRLSGQAQLSGQAPREYLDYRAFVGSIVAARLLRGADDDDGDDDEDEEADEEGAEPADWAWPSQPTP